MKRNAIVRIVLFSIVILLLTALLAAGLGLGTLVFQLPLDDGSYTTGGSELPPNEIHRIDIEWAAGSITIISTDTDSIRFSETGATSTDTELVYELSGDTLKIRYQRPAFMIGFFSAPAKDLTIAVPAGWECAALSIDAASANVDIVALTAGKVDLDTASGICNFRSCNIGALEIDAASGDITYSGALEDLDVDCASSDITAVFTSAPQSIDIDGASGDADITLPADCGFSVQMDTLSGVFRSDQPTIGDDGRHTYGDGYCRINVDGVSGNVTIREQK